MHVRSAGKICFVVSLCILLSFLESIAEDQGLRILCDEWPPYQVVEKGRLTGFSTQVISTVLNRMGVPVASIEVYPWRRALMMMEENKVDALFSANYTVERSGFAYYPSETLVESPWVLWVRKQDRLKFESYQDLAQNRIGVVLGYSYTEAFWHFLLEHNNFEEVISDVQNFRKLDAGRIDCTVAELGNGNYIKKVFHYEEIVPLLQNPIKSDGLYILFNKKRTTPDLVQRFSDELKKFKAEALYQDLVQEHIGIYRHTSQK